MAVITPPTLTLPGLSPDRSDRATFTARSIARDDYIKNTQVPQLILALANVAANATDAVTSSTAAASSVTAAATQAGLATTNGAAQVSLAATQVSLAAAQVTLATNQAAAASSSAAAAGAIAWVSGTTYAVGAARFSLMNFQTYRREIAGAGTVDPALDTVNWFNANVGDVSNLPNLRPTLNLNFANSQIVDPRITFTRASTATRINAKGLIESVLSNVPRINFDPVTLACRGLLIEEQRTNLLLYSEQFDNAAWQTFGTVAKTANTHTAPDGTLTADTVTLAASSGIFQAPITTAGQTYTHSLWIRGDTSQTVRLLSNTNLSEITFITVSVTTSWQRVNLVKLTTTGISITFQIDASSTGAAFQIWGAQLEAAAFATSYIPTVAAQVTRATDVATMTGANFSSWYNQASGTWVFNGNFTSGANDATARVAYGTSDGTFNNSIYESRLANSLAEEVNVFFAGAQQSSLAQFNTPVETAFKAAFAFLNNDLARSVNGGTVSTDTVATIPGGQAQLVLGSASWNAGASAMCGHIQSLAYFSKRLTNLELQALTTQ